MIVNSLHSYLIEELAPGLVAEAVAESGTIEAVSVREAPGFNLGTAFHPEYWAGSDPSSTKIITAFGAAARQHAASHARAGGWLTCTHSALESKKSTSWSTARPAR
jgi:putative glutamine amidotransferase